MHASEAHSERRAWGRVEFYSGKSEERKGFGWVRGFQVRAFSLEGVSGFICCSDRGVEKPVKDHVSTWAIASHAQWRFD
jgi:hypothetical protein